MRASTDYAQCVTVSGISDVPGELEFGLSCRFLIDDPDESYFIPTDLKPEQFLGHNISSICLFYQNLLRK